MPRLSIIIPWWDADAGAAFEDTLVSALQHRPSRSELVVVHAHAYDDPYRVRDEGVRLVQLAAQSEIGLINAALPLATAPLVHIVRCGITMQEGWSEAALEAFRDPQVAAVAAWIVQRQDPSRLAAAGLGYGLGGERRVVGVGRQLQQASEHAAAVVSPLLDAGFYRRQLLLEMGGFDEQLGALADLDVGLTLQSLGGRCVSCSECQVMGEVRQLEPGFRTGRQLERLFWRHARRHSQWRAIIAHGWSMIVRSLHLLPSPTVISELAGRMVGLLDGNTSRATIAVPPAVAGTISPAAAEPPAATRRAA